MPPKKAGGPSKKTENKKKEKVLEDKTFGLKNKKGSKMQKFVQQIEHQVKHGNVTKEKLLQEKLSKKKGVEDDLKDISKLIKPVLDTPKTGKDVDPKSILCAFFKQGMCTKGSKCKWSHDLNIQNKVVKKNVYFDSRDLKKDEETNENWDDNKLKEVAEKKHGDKDRRRPNQTDIICKYFLDAVENNKYGWFWECQNGESCIYRHALPEGYILKKDKKRLEELNKREEISLEELIEKERSALNSLSGKKVTLETFIEWKKARLREKKVKDDEEIKQKKKDARLGRYNTMTGKELFMFASASTTQDADDEDGVDVDYNKEVEEEENIEAFDIDDRTFLVLQSGQVLDEGLDIKNQGEKKDDDGDGLDVDEDLFNDDEDIPDISDDESNIKNKVENLKI
uniref:Zinc finger CCCH domain-containing protein 15 homolog n=1 Tax=Parastrongyloides trichosuri TaxID=131310 RepID=A0A0N4ZPJ8_PARTI